MSSKKNQSGMDGQDRIITEARRYRDQREKTYRGQALKMYPWICARCGREFSGKKLRELTVHHKDHNHDHNPPDGSNWEFMIATIRHRWSSRLSLLSGSIEQTELDSRLINVFLLVQSGRGAWLPPLHVIQ